ncbi:MAG: hypothetical protein EXR98_23585 [Gemmataceae bacterium]|nr:hypothetical protein [Gemmataceae bacterium]
MSDYLGNSRSNGTLKQLAPKPARTQSMRLRVALIAAAALVLGVTGLIAQAVSGDAGFSLPEILGAQKVREGSMSIKEGRSVRDTFELESFRSAAVADGASAVDRVVAQRLRRRRARNPPLNQPRIIAEQGPSQGIQAGR